MIKTSDFALITTFPNWAWDVYAKRFCESVRKYWPDDAVFLVKLDDGRLEQAVSDVINNEKETNAISSGICQEMGEFLRRNMARENKENYRLQACRFAFKVFAIWEALQAIKNSPDNPPRYLVWCDGDVEFTQSVTDDLLKAVCPSDGEMISYLGRRDWNHSECGWMVFDLHSGADEFISRFAELYIKDEIFNLSEWHDSFVFDHLRLQYPQEKFFNISSAANGRDVWEQTILGAFSKHYKGPKSKGIEKDNGENHVKGARIRLETKNSVDKEVIHRNIAENNKLIQKWLQPLSLTAEKVVVASAGPSLNPYEFPELTKVVAVKHAIERLEDAGIEPWACILLDPRPHVEGFVKEANPNTKYFVATQVDPSVTQTLLEQGCEVWGWNATVGADEIDLLKENGAVIVHSGTASATRGLYLLEQLGFQYFECHGYDLCYFDKPDMELKDQHGQPKYLEVSMQAGLGKMSKRVFWTEGQYLAQMEEVEKIIKERHFPSIVFKGFGIAPWLQGQIEHHRLQYNKNRLKLDVNRFFSERK